jgi:hypothetical protein
MHADTVVCTAIHTVHIIGKVLLPKRHSIDAFAAVSAV